MFSFIIISISQGLLSLGFAMIIYGIGFGGSKVMTNTLFTENVSSDDTAFGMSLRFTMMNIGHGFGSIIIGFLNLVTSMSSIFALSGLILLPSIIILFLIDFKDHLPRAH